MSLIPPSSNENQFELTVGKVSQGNPPSGSDSTRLVSSVEHKGHTVQASIGKNAWSQQVLGKDYDGLNPNEKAEVQEKFEQFVAKQLEMFKEPPNFLGRLSKKIKSFRKKVGLGTPSEKKIETLADDRVKKMTMELRDGRFQKDTLHTKVFRGSSSKSPRLTARRLRDVGNQILQSPQFLDGGGRAIGRAAPS